MPLTPFDFLESSAEVLSEAISLQKSGMTKGACSRSYYAVFDATRAALESIGVDTRRIRSHKALHDQFYLKVVQKDKIDRGAARAFTRTQQLRKLADYGGGRPSAEQASESVERAHEFITGVKNQIFPTDDLVVPEIGRLSRDKPQADDPPHP